jgi:hypothetical protein
MGRNCRNEKNVAAITINRQIPGGNPRTHLRHLWRVKNNRY